ncbi:phosphoribosyl-ATP pyrophosphohydrolase [Paenibacillus psychroresistens]|uniref:Phosphoribosyl-ATP pyrophosphohydrolase n=1 Tax=Paenibacillus psychroresistens TaxID=1778678 RepID=A0A6B8RKE0_9BACL|nr:nucleoside triphosphate pyrophosphohydrolase [Paenibacillus psychroresistens]QGQ95886.1 phosphoribosyl-ATP pyrophosphohydrolase [Paenibacillus psychroresistens]
MKIYNKLIRDKIPQIMESKGVMYSVSELSEDEYSKKLNEKLQEELDEYLTASPSDQVEELADLVELVFALLENKGVSIEEFEEIRIKKREDRGGFEKRLLLISTE